MLYDSAMLYKFTIGIAIDIDIPFIINNNNNTKFI